MKKMNIHTHFARSHHLAIYTPPATGHTHTITHFLKFLLNQLTVKIANIITLFIPVNLLRIKTFSSNTAMLPWSQPRNLTLVQ